MKKIKFLLVSLITIFVFNINVFAASGSLGVSSSSVYVGDSFTVTSNVNSVAAWNVHVSASGPVSGCVINQAEATADAMDTNKTFSATCTATGEGTITVSLNGDVTSASDGNPVIISGSKSVTVSKRPTSPSNNSNNNNSNSNNTSSNNNNSNINTENKSKNNDIKELSIEGYDLVKVDNNNYTLSVYNDITSINVKAIVADSKSKVTGTGNHNINVGENNIEIVVIAENGAQNKINIKVTRKDGYYLEDLESVLKNNKINNINITIKADTKLTSNDLEKIKDSKKIVKFNYYNENKNLVYSWIIDGSKINNISNDINTSIKFDSENKKDILRLSNYADGMYVHFTPNSILPKGMSIKLFVGDKFDDSDMVNVYYYNKQKDTLDLIEKKLSVKDGYIEFKIDKTSDYFVTMSNIQNANEKTVTNIKNNSIILPIVIVIICLLIILVIVTFIIKNKKKKNSHLNQNNSIINKPIEELQSIDDNSVVNEPVEELDSIDNNFIVNEQIEELYSIDNDSLNKSDDISYGTTSNIKDNNDENSKNSFY